MMYKYEKVIYYSSDDECWIVEVPELPGCMADGETEAEALANSDIIIGEWIETALMLGNKIPQPAERHCLVSAEAELERLRFSTT